jgi:hypothetical protein
MFQVLMVEYLDRLDVRPARSMKVQYSTVPINLFRCTEMLIHTSMGTTCTWPWHPDRLLEFRASADSVARYRRVLCFAYHDYSHYT